MARKKDWVFTARRKEAMRKAQKKHKYLVDLGKRAYNRGMR